MAEDIGLDAIALAVMIERTHGHKNPPPGMSFDQVNMICATLRKTGEEVLRLRGAQ